MDRKATYLCSQDNRSLLSSPLPVINVIGTRIYSYCWMLPAIHLHNSGTLSWMKSLRPHQLPPLLLTLDRILLILLQHPRRKRPSNARRAMLRCLLGQNGYAESIIGAFMTPSFTFLSHVHCMEKTNVFASACLMQNGVRAFHLVFHGHIYVTTSLNNQERKMKVA